VQLLKLLHLRVPLLPRLQKASKSELKRRREFLRVVLNRNQKESPKN
jgi:hypothetical protein